MTPKWSMQCISISMIYIVILYHRFTSTVRDSNQYLLTLGQLITLEQWLLHVYRERCYKLELQSASEKEMGTHRRRLRVGSWLRKLQKDRGLICHEIITCRFLINSWFLKGPPAHFTWRAFNMTKEREGERERERERGGRRGREWE